jgi:hypothetical protein
LKWIVMSTSKINARSIIINSISHSQLQNLFVHNSGYEKTKYNFEIRPIDELSNSYLKIKHTITFIV